MGNALLACDTVARERVDDGRLDRGRLLRRPRERPGHLPGGRRAGGAGRAARRGDVAVVAQFEGRAPGAGAARGDGHVDVGGGATSTNGSAASSRCAQPHTEGDPDDRRQVRGAPSRSTSTTCWSRDDPHTFDDLVDPDAVPEAVGRRGSGGRDVRAAEVAAAADAPTPAVAAEAEAIAWRPRRASRQSWPPRRLPSRRSSRSPRGTRAGRRVDAEPVDDVVLEPARAQHRHRHGPEAARHAGRPGPEAADTDPTPGAHRPVAAAAEPSSRSALRPPGYGGGHGRTLRPRCDDRPVP